MTKVFSKKNPSNSRIYIDVKNKKVGFSYPNKKSEFYIVLSFFINLIGFVFLIFLVVNIPLFFLYILLQPVSSSNISHNNSFYIIPPLFFIFSEFIYIFLNLTLLPTFIFLSSDKLMSKMPELNRKFAIFTGSKKKYIKLFELNSKIYEIPIFDNVFMEYKVAKDFQKYLDNIEIIEHDFHFLEEPNIFQQLLGFKKKKIRNDSDWKVRFIFNKIPRKGWLEVIYM